MMESKWGLKIKINTLKIDWAHPLETSIFNEAERICKIYSTSYRLLVSLV